MKLKQEMYTLEESRIFNDWLRVNSAGFKARLIQFCIEWVALFRNYLFDKVANSLQVGIMDFVLYIF